MEQKSKRSCGRFFKQRLPRQYQRNDGNYDPGHSHELFILLLVIVWLKAHISNILCHFSFSTACGAVSNNVSLTFIVILLLVEDYRATF